MSIIILAVIIVSVIGLILGIGLSFASVALEVPVNEKIEEIREHLPGANCGGCGYSGCDSYAEAVASGEADPSLCAPGGVETAKKLAELMGGSGEYVAKIARVNCGGGCEHTQKKYIYRGMGGCAAVNALQKGDISCTFGCLGRGDCVEACANNAIYIGSDGLAHIDGELCIGCGMCKAACPRDIISIVPKTAPTAHINCNNKAKGAAVKKSCTVACLGCGLCAKLCEADAIIIENNLASIDPTKCTACGKCAEKCPTKAIEML